ncbi:unnamed protein product, partial [Effrenium voratum]
MADMQHQLLRLSDQMVSCFGGLFPCMQEKPLPPAKSSTMSVALEDRGQVEAQIRQLRSSIQRRRAKPGSNSS